MFRFLLNRRLWAVVLVVAAILAVALRPQIIEVDVARASRGDLLITIDEDGETRVRQRFVVAAPVTGRLQRIELEPGDRVVRGQALARLTPSTPELLDSRSRAELSAGVEAAQASLEQARAERDRAMAVLERARALVKRQQELAAAGAIAKDRLEADEAALRVAEEEVRAAEFAISRGEHEVEAARARLAQPATGGGVITVVAPAEGVVLKRLRESERDVPAGDPLLEIGNPADLEVVADLLSTDAVRISPGARVLIDEWGGNKPLSGRVRRIEPSGFLKTSALGVEEQRVNVIIDFDAPPVLGDGYRVEVRVVMAEVTNALKIPVGALFRSGESWAVFTIQENRAHIRPIQLGQRNDAEAEVISGLTEGESIILHPPDTLVEGTQVRTRT